MLGLLAASIPAVFQGISGIAQKRKANRLNPVRPMFNIPNALTESVNSARQSAGAAMPGFGTAQNNIQASTANAARAAQLAGSGNNALATIAAAQGNEANAMSNLAVQNAQFSTGQRANLQNQLGVLAGEQKNAWDWNQKEKFNEESAAKSALLDAANQNINGALSGLSSIAVSGLNKPKLTIPGLDWNKFIQKQKVGTGSYNDAALYQQQPQSIPGFNPTGFYNGYRTV